MPKENFQGDLPGDHSSHALLLQTYYNSESFVSPAFQELQNQVMSVCFLKVMF